MACCRMTGAQADTLEYFLRSLSFVKDVRVYENTQDAVIRFSREGDVYERLLESLAGFSYQDEEAEALSPIIQAGN